MTSGNDYDAIVLVSFGGPEARQDVLPFLENVTRGRQVPRERLLEVAEHYYRFDGVSPLNGQVRELREALVAQLASREIDLPIYWGNRNWDPLLPNTMAEMAAEGVKHVLAVVLAGYSSYSSCRQYREDLESARQSVGDHAPTVDKVRAFFNHPEFVSATAECLQAALGECKDPHVAFTAHSLPSSMAAGCDYESQLNETARLVCKECGVSDDRWQVVYQSRSGRPQDPWLEPDILDHMRSLNERGVSSLVVHPIGFLSDHLEVLFDLDVEASELAGELGMQFVRAATVGVHPTFVGMLGELIAERIFDQSERRCAGELPPCLDVCRVDCCPSGRPVRAG